MTRINTLILLLHPPPPPPSPHSPLASPHHQAGDCKQCPHPPSLGATPPTSFSEKSLFMVKQCPECGDDSWAAAIISSLIFSPHYLYRGSVQLLHVLPSSDTRDQHGTQLFGNFTVSCPLVRPRAHCHNIFPGLGDKNNMVNLINLN